MGNNNAQGRVRARRAATFLAALGALVMSSGVALMVAATPANAVAEKPSICHPVNGKGELGNGWDLISPDKASSHIDEALFPNGEYWKHESKDGLRHDMYAVNGTCPGEPIPSEECPQGTDRAGQEVPDGQDSEEFCNDDEEQPLVATATATPNTPTCANNVPSYTKSGTNIEAAWKESAAPAFGATITVTATAVKGAEFAGGASTKAIEVTFPAAATGCGTVVNPPQTTQTESTVVVSPPKQHTTKTKAKAEATVTPTVVEAGLAGTSTDDLRGEQGLALMVAGMVMLVAAGGLGLRVRGATARS